MTDTPAHIYKKQFEILMAKPLKERFMQNLQMSEVIRQMAQKRIKREHPGFNEVELKIEMFKAFYSSEFSEEVLSQIVEAIKEREHRVTQITAQSHTEYGTESHRVKKTP